MWVTVLYLVGGHESFGFALIVFGCVWRRGLYLLVDWVSCLMEYRSLSRWVVAGIGFDVRLGLVFALGVVFWCCDLISWVFAFALGFWAVYLYFGLIPFDFEITC